MPFRSTQGILSADGDPSIAADVIMTAAAPGLAASYISETARPFQFDVPKELEKSSAFDATVSSMDAAVSDHLAKKNLLPGAVKFGTSPGYAPGTMIMGVYKLAGQSAARSVSEARLSAAGEELLENIWCPTSESVHGTRSVQRLRRQQQYRGRHEYPLSPSDSRPGMDGGAEG